MQQQQHDQMQQQQQQPAAEAEHPMGFGAERANLMEEAPISMDNVKSDTGLNTEETKATHEEHKVATTAADERLRAEAE